MEDDIVEEARPRAEEDDFAMSEDEMDDFIDDGRRAGQVKARRAPKGVSSHGIEASPSLSLVPSASLTILHVAIDTCFGIWHKLDAFNRAGTRHCVAICLMMMCGRDPNYTPLQRLKLKLAIFGAGQEPSQVIMAVHKPPTSCSALTMCAYCVKLR